MAIITLARRPWAPSGRAASAGRNADTGSTPAAVARRATLHQPAGRRLGVQVQADLHWDPAVHAPRSAPFNHHHQAAAGRATSSSSLAAKPTAATKLGSSVQQVDFLVIGSGIAGLSYALRVAQYGSVAIVTKDFANEGCTQYAQGGVCAVLDRFDSVDEHVRDTMVAGAFLNDPQ
jgi:hypothetical protein